MRLQFARRYVRQYRKLPPDLKEKVNERLRMFAENEFHPLLDNHKLTGEWTGRRSINITGDYRAIYEPHPNLAYFVTVGTHSELYGN